MFYTDKDALLLNAKFNNLVYGAAAPNAPAVFIDDQQLARLWQGTERYYVVASQSTLPRFEELLTKERIYVVTESGGKFVLTNYPLESAGSESSSSGT
jgi:hypothetical protein